MYTYMCVYFFNQLRVSTCSKAIIRLYIRIKNIKLTTVIVFKFRRQLLTSVKIA
jgi:hypothetical protein